MLAISGNAVWRPGAFLLRGARVFFIMVSRGIFGGWFFSLRFFREARGFLLGFLLYRDACMLFYAPAWPTKHLHGQCRSLRTTEARTGTTWGSAVNAPIPRWETVFMCVEREKNIPCAGPRWRWLGATANGVPSLGVFKTLRYPTSSQGFKIVGCFKILKCWILWDFKILKYPSRPWNPD